MDFKLDIDAADAEMTFDPAGNIMNNIYLSLTIRKGSFFQNPEFGSRLHLLFRAKNTERTEMLAREYCKEALQWLLDTERATEIDVYTERDPLVDPSRLKIKVTATQRNGEKVTYDRFLEVV